MELSFLKSCGKKTIYRFSNESRAVIWQPMSAPCDNNKLNRPLQSTHMHHVCMVEGVT